MKYTKDIFLPTLLLHPIVLCLPPFIFLKFKNHTWFILAFNFSIQILTIFVSICYIQFMFLVGQLYIPLHFYLKGHIQDLGFHFTLSIPISWYFLVFNLVKMFKEKIMVEVIFAIGFLSFLVFSSKYSLKHILA